ncbi:MAG: conserved rane protein of unknown function [Nitrosarchaeum sp.]|nr:conserved rane protein of unknown function [Nitrosarchaeum sp.]
MKEILKLVFSNYKYVVLASVLFSSMLIILLIISEYIFLDPYVIGYISPGTELGFGLIVILSGLSALVIPLNVYRINIFNKSKRKMSAGVFGSFIGTMAGACSCGPIGFAIISTFGIIGATNVIFVTSLMDLMHSRTILILQKPVILMNHSFDLPCVFSLFLGLHFIYFLSFYVQDS